MIAPTGGRPHTRLVGDRDDAQHTGAPGPVGSRGADRAAARSRRRSHPPRPLPQRVPVPAVRGAARRAPGVVAPPGVPARRPTASSSGSCSATPSCRRSAATGGRSARSTVRASHRPVTAQRGHTLVSSDPPGHTRMRKLISAGFTPRMIHRLDEQIAERTTQVLDAAAAARARATSSTTSPTSSRCTSSATSWASPKPTVPTCSAGPTRSWPPRTPRSGSPHEEQFAAGIDSSTSTPAHLGEEKRRHPTDDVWSILTTAEVEDDDGDAVAPHPVGARPVLPHPHHRRLGDHAVGRSRAASWRSPTTPSSGSGSARPVDGAQPAVEEILRWTSPVACFARTATADVEVGGQQIRGRRPGEPLVPGRQPRPARRSTGPTSSTSPASRTRTCRSVGAAPTSASARTWPATRSARCSPSSSPGSRTWRSSGHRAALVSAPEQTIAVTLRDLPVRLAP